MKPEDIQRDPLMRQLFEDAGELRPSSQFTDTILKQLKKEAQSSAYKYTPIISKKAWLVICLLGAAMFVLAFFTTASQQPASWNIYGYNLQIDTSLLQKMADKVVFSFEFSPIMKTSMLALAIFIFVQLIVFELKNRAIFK